MMVSRASGRWSRLAGTLALFAASALAVQAQDIPSLLTSTPPNSATVPVAVATMPTFGTTTYETISISAYDFHEFRQTGTVTGVNDDGNGFSWATGGTNPIFLASFPVPAGVVIDWVGLHYCDTSAAGNFLGVLYDVRSDATFSTIINTNFPDSPCGTQYNAAPAGYAWNGNADHALNLYVFQVGTAVAGEVKFRGAEVWFKRVVSPAPGAATFGDVPTSDFGFQFVEALAASGITGGCSVAPPLYCPDAFVTRRQMAIFIAKALGLSFPE